MNVSVIRASELDSSQVGIWSRLQEADSALASPFFRPEFTVAVAGARDDAYVGVLEQDGVVAGFFPFQRGRLPIGIPVGGERSNYQGVIAGPHLVWDAASLLRGCGLRAWDFDHLITTQAPFERFHRVFDDSPYIDLTAGFDGYAADRGEYRSKVIKRLRQQRRRIEREVGTLRYVPHEPSGDILRTMMRWKSEQYLATNSEDRFADCWNVELMERIHAERTECFRGWLPALYVEDRLAAVAMCMGSFGVLHYWFPTYDKTLASYSPGLLLLLAMAEQAEAVGVHTIDLGRGHAPYKDRLASGVIRVAEGTATIPSALTTVRGLRDAAERSIRGSRLRGPARRVASVARSLSHRARARR